MTRVLRAPLSHLPFPIAVLRPPIPLAALMALSAVSALAQAPIINSINPTSALAGSNGFTLVVNTNNFAVAVGTAPQIFFGSVSLATGTQGNNVWTGTVPSNLLTTTSVVPVTMRASSGISNAVNFTIVGPSITGFNPTSLTQSNARSLDILG